eukprot:CAMPEP_0116564512 /NCGR_PEP_ID=MMETSP0397-20121206/13346_1 /TAXON_ID=216820 /ORGANISM="Cyclophora tenuis, Strain ECT3854" /LENGTH=572 /DNA_ID=CAMNT_0004091107 /DNA_START=245 /DNA_END=1963 /DNA_ORIENTATION=-
MNLRFDSLFVLLLLQASRPASALSPVTFSSVATRIAEQVMTRTRTVVQAPPDLLKSGGLAEACRELHRHNGQECPTAKMVAGLELPYDFPQGTYYRNGPGRFNADDGTSVIHPFDGDGLVTSLRITGKNNEECRKKNAFWTSRFVHTPGYLKDIESGKMTGRGVFGSMKSGGWFNNVMDIEPKHVANTNVIRWGDHLWALWEGGRPFLLDPETLETVDVEYSANNRIQGTFAAHPRKDPSSSHYFNFGVDDLDPAAGRTKIHYYELDDGEVVSTPTAFTLPGAAMMHDHLVTDNYLLMVWTSAEFNGLEGLKGLLGLGSFVAAIDITPKTEVLLIPKDILHSSDDVIDATTDPRIKRIPVPYQFNYHLGNGYEKDGKIIFDAIETTDEEFDFCYGSVTDKKPVWEIMDFDEMEPFAFAQYTIDVENEQYVGKQIITDCGSIEFPVVPTEMSGKEHQYIYTVASHNPHAETSGTPGTICKWDLENDEMEHFSFRPEEMVGEPAFVPKIGGEDEDSGYLIVLVNNGMTLTTDVVVLDVEGPGSLSRGPIARSRLPSYVPGAGLHGRFVRAGKTS